MIGYDSYRAACFSPPDTLDTPECACGDELAIGPLGLYCPSCEGDTETDDGERDGRLAAS